MPLSFNTVHHYRYEDSQGNEVSSNRFGAKAVPVDNEQHFMDKYGPKKIVSMETFIMYMLRDLSPLEYLYPDTVVACLHAISYTRHIKCEESADEVLERCKEALSILFPINSYTKAEV